MHKTITLRLPDEAYKMFKTAAEGEHRSISNFMEWATYSYIHSAEYVSDKEMKDILSDEHDLKIGLRQAKEGKYKAVRGL